MISFKILYFEHDSSRTQYTPVLEKHSDGGLVVVTNIDAFSQAVKKNNFNLVVTDAFFLEEDKDHTSQNAGEYLLDVIIGLVKEFQGDYTKIAVLSRFSSEVLLLPEFQQVDYLLDKDSIQSLDRLDWQVGRIVSSCVDKVPSRLLLDEIAALCKKEGMQWGESISKMINSYIYYKDKANKIDHIRADFSEIARAVELNKPFNSLFELLVYSEQLNISAKPKAFGHLRHSLNVFWLGYYLINSQIISLDAIDNDFFPSELELSAAGFSQEDYINTIWLIGSMFHDIGYIMEIQSDLVDRCNSAIEDYFQINSFLTIKEFYADISDSFEEEISLIKKDSPEEFHLQFEKYLQNIKDEKKCDHAFLSAILVYKKFKNFIESSPTLDYGKVYSKIIKNSVMAICLHNFLKNTVDIEQFFKFKFKEHPIISLLLFCDQIQIWERDTKTTSSFVNMIDYIEISRLELVKEVLEIVINYQPYEHISTEDYDRRVEVCSEFSNILSDKVFPVLNQIDYSEVLRTNIRIEFRFDKKKLLTEWSSAQL